MKKLLFLVLMLSTLFMVGCISEASTGKDNDPDLINTKWECGEGNDSWGCNFSETHIAFGSNPFFGSGSLTYRASFKNGIISSISEKYKDIIFEYEVVKGVSLKLRKQGDPNWYELYYEGEMNWD